LPVEEMVTDLIRPDHYLQQNLEERFMKVQCQLERERELQIYLKEHRGVTNEYRMLGFQAERVRQEVASLCHLQSQVESMERQLEIAREEKALAREGEQLAGIIEQLKEQRSWVTLATLAPDIARAQGMLAGLKEEIKRHQSWLERLMRQKEERSRK
jgi:hypothetical protein